MNKKSDDDNNYLKKGRPVETKKQRKDRLSLLNQYMARMSDRIKDWDKKCTTAK